MYKTAMEKTANEIREYVKTGGMFDLTRPVNYKIPVKLLGMNTHINNTATTLTPLAVMLGLALPAAAAAGYGGWKQHDAEQWKKFFGAMGRAPEMLPAQIEAALNTAQAAGLAGGFGGVMPTLPPIQVYK
jgi:hypothetical protein